MSVAAIPARSLTRNHHIKVVPFEKNIIVPLQAGTFTATEIQFGRNEIIESIQNGDIAAWTVDVLRNFPNTLFIKPTILGSNTNMTVITNQHSYYFHLSSQASLTSNASNIYALKFIYPVEVKRMNSSLNIARNPADYHWDYSFHGSRSIMPLHVFDDGKFTYMELRAGQAISAIFAVDTKDGAESVVNFRREGQYLVIHRVVPQFTLREGKRQVASIFNNLVIRKNLHG